MLEERDIDAIQIETERSSSLKKSYGAPLRVFRSTLVNQ